jgi:hypothetical protein
MKQFLRIREPAADAGEPAGSLFGIALNERNFVRIRAA